jgi:hypothetical protein
MRNNKIKGQQVKRRRHGRTERKEKRGEREREKSRLIIAKPPYYARRQSIFPLIHRSLPSSIALLSIASSLIPTSAAISRPLGPSFPPFFSAASSPPIREAQDSVDRVIDLQTHAAVATRRMSGTRPISVLDVEIPSPRESPPPFCPFLSSILPASCSRVLPKQKRPRQF